MSFEYNSQQEHAVNYGAAWYKSIVKAKLGTRAESGVRTPWNASLPKQTYEISGPAGSGKTTIVYGLAKETGLEKHEILFMAFVGKATMALARKGNFAKTIHSSIYDLIDVPRMDVDGNIMQKNGRVLTTFAFVKKEKLPDEVKLIVVDEGSMVAKPMAEDILSFGLPVVVLGDLDQLPPVFGSSYFLIKPDVILTQVMRQREGDPIIMLSQMAIKGQPFQVGQYGKSSVIYKSQLNDEILKSVDIIICGTNEARENINNYYRKNLRGSKNDIPLYGDKIICRQNNWKLKVEDEIYLINGLIGFIENIYLETYNGKSICIDFRPDFMKPGEVFRKVRIDYEFLFMPVTQKSNKMSYYNKFQYSYAITTHLSQGSQYPKVLYYRENLGRRKYQCQVDYVGISRAEEEIIIAIDEPVFNF